MEGNFVITGAAQGFGKEFSRRVMAAGGRVVLADKDQGKGAETCSNFRQEFGPNSCTFQAGDVSSREDWADLWKVADEFFGDGGVDVLVNNAGVSPTLGFDLNIKVNFEGVLNGSRGFQDKFGRAGGGKGGLVVNVASLAGLFTGFEEENICYQIAKHGTVGLTRSFGHSIVVKKTGIKHVAICPWFADTNLLANKDVGALKKKVKVAFVTVERVGEAFEQVVKDARSGSCMAVMTDWPLTYYPDMTLFKSPVPIIVYLLARLANMLGLQVLRPGHMMGLLAFFAILFVYISHMALSAAGL